MLNIDLPLEQLATFTLPLTRQPDFSRFWEEVVASSRKQPLRATEERLAYPVTEVRVERVRFAAYDGGEIVGWFVAPPDQTPGPVLVLYHGYGWYKGNVCDHLLWPLQGISVLAVDTRGQPGDSSDLAAYPGGRNHGWMTWGILEPRSYYFVRAYADAVRAVDYVRGRKDVDPARIAVSGGSQGGMLSMAAAAFDKTVALCMPDVPGFGHVRRTLELTRAQPWPDLTGLFQRFPEHVDTAFRTMSYVELNNLAPEVTCPTLVSVGLEDQLVPPSTVYTVYNHLAAKTKEIVPYPFNGHEGGLAHRERQIVWARRHLLGERV
jgi:cephalosporin-C deacetylase